MATYASLKYDFGAQLSGEIPTAAIADNAVTLAKMASGTDGNIITYDASGNPAVVTTGSADQVLTSAGAGAPPTMSTAVGGGFSSMQVFTSSGTWTKPSGVKTIRIQLVGSGASGNHSGQGGAAGGYSEDVVDVTSVSTVSVTVGAAATAGNTVGATSSFGAYCSATGGAKGASARGGKPGLGADGQVNGYGGGGGWSGTGSGHGGTSYFGGGDHDSDTTREYDIGNNAYGGGGMGIENGYTQYGISRGGLVLVYEYKQESKVKKILVVAANNYVAEVTDKEFEVSPSFVWKTVDNDDVQQGWTYVPDDNSVFDTDKVWLATDEGKRHKMVTDRQMAYGKIGDQLDALYRDLRDDTTKWVDHITAVKAATPKADRVDPLEKDTVTGE